MLVFHITFGCEDSPASPTKLVQTVWVLHKLVREFPAEHWLENSASDPRKAVQAIHLDLQ